MNVGGDPSLWAVLFPDGLVARLIDLVFGAWATFPQPAVTDREVPITKRFCVCLRAHRNRSETPFAIEWESPELDPCSGEERGRIDLKFVHGHRETVYFALECKRLNVVFPSRKRESLASEYVQEGMMRFIGGKYARELDKGGMLGYVMDGDVPSAIRAVASAVKARRDALRMADGSLERSSVLPNERRARESRHSVGRRPLAIHHLFVAVGNPGGGSEL